jgi:hypothetical protein
LRATNLLGEPDRDRRRRSISAISHLNAGSRGSISHSRSGSSGRSARNTKARRRFGMYVERMAEIGVEAPPFPTPLRVA